MKGYINLVVLLFWASNHLGVDSGPISTWAPEIDLDGIAGIPCCDLHPNDVDINLNINFGLDHPHCGLFRAPPPPPPLAARIFQGRDAYEGQFPWLVTIYLIMKRDRDEKIIAILPNCGGVILDEKHILTAAHCVHGETIIHLAFGIHDYSDLTDLLDRTISMSLVPRINVFFPQNHKVIDAGQRIHTGDLAVIKLRDKIRWLNDTHNGEVVNPICWRSIKNYIHTDCQNITIAGFGRIYGNSSKPWLNRRLQTRRHRICDQEHCQLRDTKETMSQYWDEMCSARRMKPRSLVCAGDSGSPVLSVINKPNENPALADKRALLVGVVARGQDECQKTVDSSDHLIVSRHTRLMDHIRWVEGVVDEDPNYVGRGWLSRYCCG